jgi:hypothetical protein
MTTTTVNMFSYLIINSLDAKWATRNLKNSGVVNFTTVRMDILRTKTT